MPISYGYSLVGTSGTNGDMFFISPDNNIIMLADGASGAGKEGKVIMSHLCADIIKANPFTESGLTAVEYLDKTIWQINNALIAVSQEKKQYIFGTLVICVIAENTAYIAAVGDSPAYFIHAGTVRQVAKSAKTYQNLIDMGFYSAEQLDEAVHKLPEHMWSMFDCFIPMVVPKYTIEEISITAGDVIVLCCDGVSDYISPDCIKDNIRAESLQNDVRSIIEAAKQASISARGCIRYDDLTMVAYCM